MALVGTGFLSTASLRANDNYNRHDGKSPDIDSAVVNSSTNRVTIAGHGLKRRYTPAVALAGLPLTIVGTATATTIVANLPANLPAGTYLLTVVVDRDRDYD